jgi:Spy/CpxP family protein refolding chaperone
MARHLTWVLVAVLSAPVAAATGADCEQRDNREERHQPASQQPQGGRPKWWMDPKLRQALGITDQQSRDIEAVFQSSITNLRESRHQLERLEEIMSKTIAEHTADVPTITQQVEQVEAARSKYNKLRTVMLYRIDLLLSPDQRVKVKEMHERNEAERRKQSDRSERR